MILTCDATMARMEFSRRIGREQKRPSVKMLVEQPIDRVQRRVVRLLLMSRLQKCAHLVKQRIVSGSPLVHRRFPPNSITPE